jgi:hypothetical protein
MPRGQEIGVMTSAILAGRVAAVGDDRVTNDACVAVIRPVGFNSSESGANPLVALTESDLAGRIDPLA